MKQRTALLMVTALVVLVGFAGPTVSAQWSNRYPRVQGFSHIYLEGYELPTLTNGPIDPAPSPDVGRIAFSARGWIWVLETVSGSATRITRGGEVDSRPAWSPDGRLLAFVRDDTQDTWIVVLDVESGDEVATIQTPAIELDPTFSPDSRSVVYASAEAGDLDLWAHDLESGERSQLTNDTELLELRPQTSADGTVYVSKQSGGLNKILFRPESKTRTPGFPVTSAQDVVLMTGRITSQTRPALSPDGAMVAFNWPTQSGWELRVLRVEDPGETILLNDGGVFLTPAWGADGAWIYFSEPDDAERMVLKRIRAVGGSAEPVDISSWHWGEPMSVVRVRTNVSGVKGPTPARLNVVDRRGHPAVPDRSAARFDGQSGRVYFYSPGVVELTVPAGSVTVSAVRGLATPEVSATVEADAGSITDVVVSLEPVWNAREAGWTSGEHHFHLNYGGQYDLSPSDLVPMMAGEDLDLATPLLANLHNRFEDQDLWKWEKSDTPPMIRFGQEIRSHFLGHMGLIEINDLHWPWVWGPRYQVYGSDDRTNASALDYAHSQGGLGYYVHPVSRPDPFTADGLYAIPVELVADGVLGDLDALEIVCLWSNEIGTAEVWYQLLNLGVPVAPTAGTDVMLDFHRTMAVGTTRVYAWTGEALNWPAYLAAFREGRSFVTNGPFLDFRLEGSRPGEVVPSGTSEWTLDLRSASSVGSVDVIVNGEVVWSGEGLPATGERSYSGELELPNGGWVAARAMGGESTWPSMADTPYAHTAPVWIGARGSTEPEARQAAARRLLRALDVARQRLIAGYGAVETPKLLARFAEARARLETLVETP